MKSKQMKVQFISGGYLKFYLSGAFFLLSLSLFSQNLSQHNWYFGSSPDGIRFNRGSNQAKA
ncbi:MAG: hypothetical protein ACKOEV_15670, partial [Cytophagales bacterium]